MSEFRAQLDAWLQQGNALSWGLALGLALLLTVGARFAQRLVTKRLQPIAERSAGIWDDILLECLARTRTWAIFVWLTVPLMSIVSTDERVAKVLRGMMVVATTIQVMIWGFTLLASWRRKFLSRKAGSDASSSAALGLLYTSLEAMLIIAVGLIALSNLGVNVGALLAGLGVGGIAVALAAQNVLGDLLASLSIVLDKPFTIGDFIEVGKEAGTVENIGVKTTRVRSLSGEEIVFANKDLLENRVRNYKRMWERRVVQQFGVKYSTPQEKLAQIPKWVEEFVRRHDKLKFDRCHLTKFSDHSLDYEFVFLVTDSDYNLFMNLQQTILIDIFRKFREEKIEFAMSTSLAVNLPTPALPLSAADRPELREPPRTREREVSS